MLEAILLSAAGGFAYQIFPFIEAIRDGKTIPSQFNKETLILVTAYALLGAFFGYIYYDPNVHLNKFLIVHIGASAPMLLKTFTSMPNIPEKTD